MKRFAAILLVVLVLALSACGTSESKDVLHLDTENSYAHNGISEDISYKSIKQVELNTWRSAALTESGDLYLWGDNSYTRSNYPTKVMEDVETVRLGRDHTAAITKDKSLYMWGGNQYGQLGTGDVSTTTKPTKVLDDVIDVSLGKGISAAITTDGSLYLWGDNYKNLLGFESNYVNSDGATCTTVPTKAMDNVKDVDLSYDRIGIVTTDSDVYLWTVDDDSDKRHIMSGAKAISVGARCSAVITEDDKLYMFGSTWFKQFRSDEDHDGYYDPVYIMDNVKDVSVGDFHTGVITLDNTLYMCGRNSDGEVGNGTCTETDELVKIMDNVVDISLGCDHTAAIDSNNDLYMWGHNKSDCINVEEIYTYTSPIVVDIFAEQN